MVHSRLLLLIAFLLGICDCVNIEYYNNDTNVLESHRILRSTFSRYVASKTFSNWNPSSSDFEYFTHEEIISKVEHLVKIAPHIAYSYNIGTSVNGKDLRVIVISDKPKEHELGEPEFKYVANIHGNEVVGNSLMLGFVQGLVKNYGKDEFITHLVNETRIHVLLSMNPDGYTCAQELFSQGKNSSAQTNKCRTNKNGVDLNRDFPDYIGGCRAKSKDDVQPETLAIMDWIESRPFVLSGIFHGGALVATYPFDSLSSGSTQSASSPTPDDLVGKQLALAYAKYNSKMQMQPQCGCYNFREGVSNAAAWYPLYGGSGDYTYVKTGCIDIVFEVSCVKMPSEDQLLTHWVDNRVSIFNFVMQVHTGVKGMTYDAVSGNGISDVQVCAGGINVTVSSATDGDYWRVLAPGKYNMFAFKDGFKTAKLSATVKEDAVAVLHFPMEVGVGGESATCKPFEAKYLKRLSYHCGESSRSRGSHYIWADAVLAVLLCLTW